MAGLGQISGLNFSPSPPLGGGQEDAAPDRVQTVRSHSEVLEERTTLKRAVGTSFQPCGAGLQKLLHNFNRVIA